MYEAVNAVRMGRPDARHTQPGTAVTSPHRFHNSHHFFSCGPSLCTPVSTHCTLWGGYSNQTYYVCCIEHRVCVVHQFHCLLCPTSCLQSPMSEAVSPSMEDFGEACVGYDDSGVSEASESSSAIIREQSMADSGARTLPHGESSYSISQKWAEVGVCVSLSLCVYLWSVQSHSILSVCVCVCVYVFVRHRQPPTAKMPRTIWR